MGLWDDLYKPGTVAEQDNTGFDDVAATNDLPPVRDGIPVSGDEEGVGSYSSMDAGESSAPQTAQVVTKDENPRTMMKRLQDRDEERERVAKEEQAKLEPDRDTYNAATQTPKPKAETPVESETVQQTAASDEFQNIMQDLESEFDLSKTSSTQEEAMGASVDLGALEERVAALEAVS